MTPDERRLHTKLHDAYATGDLDTVAAITKQLDDEDDALIARLTQPGSLRNSALWYAQLGIPVFPLKAGQKVPATAHGFKDATTDADQIRAWWTATPQANIGLPTGHLFTVIDVDLPDGYLSMEEMKVRMKLPAICGRVYTASGGSHFYVKPTGEGNAAGILPGVDIRGVGGYVVAPPSRTLNWVEEWRANKSGLWTWAMPLDLDALRAEVTA